MATAPTRTSSSSTTVTLIVTSSPGSSVAGASLVIVAGAPPISISTVTSAEPLAAGPAMVIVCVPRAVSSAVVAGVRTGRRHLDDALAVGVGAQSIRPPPR